MICLSKSCLTERRNKGNMDGCESNGRYLVCRFNCHYLNSTPISV